MLISACTAETDLDAVLFSCVEDSDCVGKKVCKSPPGVCLDPDVSVAEALPDFEAPVPDVVIDLPPDATPDVQSDGGPDTKDTGPGEEVVDDAGEDTKPFSCETENDCPTPEVACHAIWCNEGVCTYSEKDELCDGGTHCLPKVCDTEAGGCVDGAIPQGDGCSKDDHPCTLEECDPSGECVVVMANSELCESDEPCVAHKCDVEQGCVASFDGTTDTPCDDNLSCTHDDACDGQGSCVGKSDCSGNAETCAPNDNQEEVEEGNTGECVPAGWATRVEVGRDLACAITSDGRVACWGAANLLGTGSIVSPTLAPSRVVLPGAPEGEAIDLAVGDDHACVLWKANEAVKQVYCWGDEGGQATYSAHYVDLEAWGSPWSITAGDGFTCALLPAGQVACWGDNDRGQCGAGSDDPLLEPSLVREPFNPSEVLTGVTSVDAGGDTACAIDEFPYVACWGDNTWGQHAGGGTPDGVSTPFMTYPVYAETWPPEGIDLSTDVSSVEVGDGHVCVVFVTDEVACWGRATHSQFGLAAPEGAVGYGFTQKIEAWDGFMKQLALGGRHTCGLTLEPHADLSCMGDNTAKQAGEFWSTITDNNKYDVLTAENAGGEPSETVVQVSAGDASTCALMADGSVLCWGRDPEGQDLLADPDSPGADGKPTAIAHCESDGECDSNLAALCAGPSECCIAQDSATCDDAGACFWESLDSTNGCDDGDSCSGAEGGGWGSGGGSNKDHCAFGVCNPGPVIDCDDEFDCTIDACDPELGCWHTAVDSDCNDGIACTEEFCNESSGCEFVGNDLECDDDDPCTINKCEEGDSDSPGCHWIPNCLTGHCIGSSGNPKACFEYSDKSFVESGQSKQLCESQGGNWTEGLCPVSDETLGDVVGGCWYGNFSYLQWFYTSSGLTPENVFSQCGTSVCDPESETCTGINNGVPCETTADCDNRVHACVLAGCAGTQCTNDLCDTSVGCLPDTNKPDGKDCLDNNMCTRDDTCQSGECIPGPLYDCNEDGDACTAEECYGPTLDAPDDQEEYGCFPVGSDCAEYTCLFPSQKLCIHINVPNAGETPGDDLCVPLADWDGWPSSGAPGFVCPEFLEVDGDGEGPGAVVAGCSVDVGTQYAMTNWYYDGTRNYSDCQGACDDDWSAENIPCAGGAEEQSACELSSQSEVTTVEDICGPNPSVCTGGPICSSTEGQDNGCLFYAYNNGSACGEQELCTEPGTCLDGTCVAAAKDCSYLDTPCTFGTCNAVTGACQSAALDEAALCDDGDPCTGQTRCYDNTCENGISQCADQSLTAGVDRDAPNNVRRAVVGDGEGGFVVFYPTNCSTEDGYSQAFAGGCVGGRIVHADGALRSMETHFDLGVPWLVGEGAEIVHLDAARGPGGEGWLLAVAWRSGLYLSDGGTAPDDSPLYNIQSKDSVTVVQLDTDLQLPSNMDVKTKEYTYGTTNDLDFAPAAYLAMMKQEPKIQGIALKTLMLGNDHALCWSEEAEDPSQSDVHCAVQGDDSGTSFYDSKTKVHTVDDQVTNLEVTGMWLSNLSHVSWVVGTRTETILSWEDRIEVFGAHVEGASIVTSDSFLACEGECKSLALASGKSMGAFLVAYGSPNDNNFFAVPTVKGLTISPEPDFVFADTGPWYSTLGEELPEAGAFLHSIRVEFTSDNYGVVLVYNDAQTAYLSAVDQSTGALLLEDPEDETSWRIPVALDDTASQHRPLLTKITPDNVGDQDHWLISWTHALRGTLGRRFNITHTPGGVTPIVGQPVLTLSSAEKNGTSSQQPKVVALDDWIAAAYQEDLEVDGIVDYKVRALNPQGLPYTETALVAGVAAPLVCMGGGLGSPWLLAHQPETMWTMDATDNEGEHDFMIYMANDYNMAVPGDPAGIDQANGMFMDLDDPTDDSITNPEAFYGDLGSCTGPDGATPNIARWPTEPGKVLGFVNGDQQTWAYTDCNPGAYNTGWTWSHLTPKENGANVQRRTDLAGFEVGTEPARRTLIVWEEISYFDVVESGVRASLWSGCMDTGTLDGTIFDPTWVIKQSDTPLELLPEWPQAATTADGSTMLIAWSLDGDESANGIYGRVITSYDVVTAPEYIAISTVNTPGMRVSFLEADPTKPGRFLVGWESQEAGDDVVPPKTLVARWIDTTSEEPDPPPFLIPTVSADLRADHGAASISPSGDVVLGWTEAPDWAIENSRALLRIIPSPGN